MKYASLHFLRSFACHRKYFWNSRFPLLILSSWKPCQILSYHIQTSKFKSPQVWKVGSRRDIFEIFLSSKKKSYYHLGVSFAKKLREKEFSSIAERTQVWFKGPWEQNTYYSSCLFCKKDKSEQSVNLTECPDICPQEKVRMRARNLSYLEVFPLNFIQANPMLTNLANFVRLLTR